ncbi:hypothetical protein A3K86_16085 [Photobacterium jeanii]|uniref:Na+/H+ antiporter NhaC-like C-terminal domain-containing protein n=1 Tax=Photobacterium jeanii TaxID=858640 RepID=A0A178K760_9GAMM|nr:Na+/H+ antiporter NhaC family protein [Photobacterium jeanii]OAN13178.1 hypothetical protein A3K86_16085 [Photobacterium jeanii]
MESRSSLNQREDIRRPFFGEAVFLLSFITLSLIVGILVFHLDVHILLIISVVLTMLFCWRCGYNLDKQIEIMGESLKNATGAMFAFILIGMIIGVWILAGTIPALIYYGLDIVSPAFFLPAGFLVCCGITYATGTNWGAASTIGVALIGMGISLGVPLPVIAGMIISGGVFGVNLSPLSDVTILASATVGTTVSNHLKAVGKVNRLVLLLSTVAYYFMGTLYVGTETGGTGHITELQTTLSQAFNMNILVLLPIVITLAMTFAKIPSQIALFCGVVVGGLVAGFVQQNSITDIFAALNYGFTHATGHELADKLLMRGGIQSMMWTFSLAFIALCMGGLLEKAHFLQVMLERILPKIKSNVSLVFTTLCTCVLGNVTTSEVYLSMILNGSLYKGVYAERGFKPEMLSRLLSEGSMTSGMLLPWTTAGAFMTATLGVSPLVYAPYAVYVWLTPIVSVLLVGMGRTLIKQDPSEPLPDESEIAALSQPAVEVAYEPNTTDIKA